MKSDHLLNTHNSPDYLRIKRKFKTHATQHWIYGIQLQLHHPEA